MCRKSITFSLFLSMAANIPPIKKHFIQWPHHWIMSKIFHFLLSTWRILGFLKCVTRSICFWYRPMLPTNKGLHLGFPADEEGFALPSAFLIRINRWFGTSTAICSQVSPSLSENKTQYLYNAALQANHVESKVLFQPILFLSERGGKLPVTTATLVTSYRTDVWRCETGNETTTITTKKTLKK